MAYFKNAERLRIFPTQCEMFFFNYEKKVKVEKWCTIVSEVADSKFDVTF